MRCYRNFGKVLETLVNSFFFCTCRDVVLSILWYSPYTFWIPPYTCGSSSANFLVYTLCPQRIPSGLLKQHLWWGPNLTPNLSGIISPLTRSVLQTVRMYTSITTILWLVAQKTILAILLSHLKHLKQNAFMTYEHQAISKKNTLTN